MNGTEKMQQVFRNHGIHVDDKLKVTGFSTEIAKEIGYPIPENAGDRFQIYQGEDKK
jgi:hypothetical protein